MDKDQILQRLLPLVLALRSISINPSLKKPKIKENHLDLVGINHLIAHILFLNCRKFQALASTKIKLTHAWQLAIPYEKKLKILLKKISHSRRIQDPATMKISIYNLNLEDFLYPNTQTRNWLKLTQNHQDSQKLSRLQDHYPILKVITWVQEENTLFHTEKEEAPDHLIIKAEKPSQIPSKMLRKPYQDQEPMISHHNSVSMDSTKIARWKQLFTDEYQSNIHINHIKTILIYLTFKLY